MVILGVDGMDPKFLERHWEDLPNLKRLAEQGDFKPLATTIPPQSPVAWSTVATGRDPGGTGFSISFTVIRSRGCLFRRWHRPPRRKKPSS